MAAAMILFALMFFMVIFFFLLLNVFVSAWKEVPFLAPSPYTQSGRGKCCRRGTFFPGDFFGNFSDFSAGGYTILKGHQWRRTDADVEESR